MVLPETLRSGINLDALYPNVNQLRSSLAVLKQFKGIFGELILMTCDCFPFSRR